MVAPNQKRLHELKYADLFTIAYEPEDANIIWRVIKIIKDGHHRHQLLLSPYVYDQEHELEDLFLSVADHAVTMVSDERLSLREKPFFKVQQTVGTLQTGECFSNNTILSFDIQKVVRQEHHRKTTRVTHDLQWILGTPLIKVGFSIERSRVISPLAHWTLTNSPMRPTVVETNWDFPPW